MLLVYKLALGHDKHQLLHRFKLPLRNLIHTPQLLLALRVLLSQDVRLAGTVAHQLAGRGDFEPLCHL